METKDLISLELFCEHYEVPDAFIKALNEYELIEIIVSENISYIKTNQIYKLEKMMRLHYELEINFEGLDVVHRLLDQMQSLQNEILELRNRLHLYEDL